MARFINPFTDVGFKRIFGQEINKDLLIDFLNGLLEGEKHIVDIRFLDKEVLQTEEMLKDLLKDYLLPPEATKVEPRVPWSPLPGGALTATPWLFQDLTETLDRRVLSSISRHDDGTLTSIDFSCADLKSYIVSIQSLSFFFIIAAQATTSGCKPWHVNVRTLTIWYWDM